MIIDEVVCEQSGLPTFVMIVGWIVKLFYDLFGTTTYMRLTC